MAEPFDYFCAILPFWQGRDDLALISRIGAYLIFVVDVPRERHHCWPIFTAALKTAPSLLKRVLSLPIHNPFSLEVICMSGDFHHNHDALVKHQSSEGQSLTPHAERMHSQVQEIAAGRGAAGSSTPSSFENNNVPSGNKAVDNLPKVDFYDSKAGGLPPSMSDCQTNPGAAGNAAGGGANPSLDSGSVNSGSSNTFSDIGGSQGAKPADNTPQDTSTPMNNGAPAPVR
jgi:hypothetical protein